MNKTGIEWATMSWNCLRGCSWASPGCNHCYAEAIARRFGRQGQPYEGCYDYQAGSWSGAVKFFEDKLDEPLKVKTPELVFANSMSDVCHPEVKPHWITAIMEIIAATPRPFYMMLTKRPNLVATKILPTYRELSGFAGDPLANLAMGTSIEHEKFLWRGYRLTEQWPGSCFLSIEPLLSRLSIKFLLRADREAYGGSIKQVIVGGESGKGARPMSPEWVRQLRDETLEAGRSFFFKQWGDGLFSPKYLRELGRTLDGREWNESPWPVPLPIKQTRIRVSPSAIPPQRLRDKGRMRGMMRKISGLNRPEGE